MENDVFIKCKEYQPADFELCLDNPYFASMLRRLDAVIRAAPATLERREAEKCCITLKINFEVEKAAVNDPDTVEGLRLTRIPHIKYKLKANYKCEETAGDDEIAPGCELIEKNGTMMIVPKDYQLSIFD